MRNKIIFFKVLLVKSILLNAQVGIGINTPNESSILEINSTDKGLLFNKTKLVATNLSSPFSNHEMGLWVYNTETTGEAPYNVYQGLYYNDGTQWIPMNTNPDIYSNKSIGDIKMSTQTEDHEGWYLMNGRDFTGILSQNAINNAITIGLNNILPDATDRMIKGISGNETFSSIGGSSTFILNKENLPNFTITGDTNSAGNHTHTYENKGLGRRGFSTLNLGNANYLYTNNTATFQTNSSGVHTHTLELSIGGTSAPITINPKKLTTNYFIFLGI